ncbi:hypothetical protein B296_00029882 [Ensete ventricosum]|uniref:Uncharacterized protein n=1 Tax=Ensete ventricosum TaxID=4639 RepID=A0A426XW36_ENSVE|nr:hypothetical protein B296_00029882 [Ensete ventricosum]
MGRGHDTPCLINGRGLGSVFTRSPYLHESSVKSIDTETRSTPLLSRVRLTFLCAIKKGASDLANAAGDAKMRTAARRKRLRIPDLGSTMARVSQVLGKPRLGKEPESRICS